MVLRSGLRGDPGHSQRRGREREEEEEEEEQKGFKIEYVKRKAAERKKKERLIPGLQLKQWKSLL